MDYIFEVGKEYNIASWDTLTRIFGLKVQNNSARCEYGVKFIPTLNVLKMVQKEFAYFTTHTKITAKYRYALHPSEKQGGDGYFYFDSHHTIEGLKNAQKRGLPLDICNDEDFEWVIKPMNNPMAGKVIIPKELNIV